MCPKGDRLKSIKKWTVLAMSTAFLGPLERSSQHPESHGQGCGHLGTMAGLGREKLGLDLLPDDPSLRSRPENWPLPQTETLPHPTYPGCP